MEEVNVHNTRHLFTGRVGDTVNKMTYKMEETDEWYEEKLHQVNKTIPTQRCHNEVAHWPMHFGVCQSRIGYSVLLL